jgi:hypothetical protein
MRKIFGVVVLIVDSFRAFQGRRKRA